MHLASASIGFIVGAFFGFKTGLGQWRVLGVLGCIIEFILAISLFNLYTMLNFEYEMVFATGLGGCLLANAIAAALSAVFNN